MFGLGDIEILKFVRKAQKLGFSLNEIRELLILRSDVGPEVDGCCAENGADLNSNKDGKGEIVLIGAASLGTLPRYGDLATWRRDRPTGGFNTNAGVDTAQNSFQNGVVAVV